MDINNQEVFEEFAPQTEEIQTATPAEETAPACSEEITFSLPESDYRKDGKLKTFRSRMLKKLLKYEFRAIMPPLYVCLGLLLGITVLACVVFNLPTYENEALASLFVITLVLYVYAVMATVIVPFTVSISRYFKHFFKEEGYLTFSIPASMEEHILAKHISGVIAALIGVVASSISVGVVLSIAPIDEIVNEIVTLIPWSEMDILSLVFETVEYLILGAETIVGVFCVAGALTCWGQKFNKKGAIVLRVVIAYVALMVLETLAMTVGAEVFVWFESDPVGIHIGNVLNILLYGAIIVLCTYYELHTLKRKLNLK